MRRVGNACLCSRPPQNASYHASSWENCRESMELFGNACSCREHPFPIHADSLCNQFSRGQSAHAQQESSQLVRINIYIYIYIYIYVHIYISIYIYIYIYIHIYIYIYIYISCIYMYIHVLHIVEGCSRPGAEPKREAPLQVCLRRFLFAPRMFRPRLPGCC